MAKSDSLPRGISIEHVDYFDRQYGLKVRVGQRFRYTGDGAPRDGTLVGTATGGKLVIMLDGEKHADLYHPTWKLAPIEEAK